MDYVHIDRLSRVEERYFQNPKFGFYFLHLSTGRLFKNIDRLEQGWPNATSLACRPRLPPEGLAALAAPTAAC